jgi:hypothetical protein
MRTVFLLAVLALPVGCAGGSGGALRDELPGLLKEVATTAVAGYVAETGNAGVTPGAVQSFLSSPAGVALLSEAMSPSSEPKTAAEYQSQILQAIAEMRASDPDSVPVPPWADGALALALASGMYLWRNHTRSKALELVATKA